MLNVLDLFSGIGGFSLGLERTGGFSTVAFCEIDPFCRRVLAKHWPEVPCYEDVRELTGARLAADGIAVDVICGGFPCQDVSVAGRGRGLAGERSGLWSEFARLIRELRPQFAIVENVERLLDRGLDAVLGDLAEIGFDADWDCIPAAYVGASHIRDRVWVVAYPMRDGLQGPVHLADDLAARIAEFSRCPPWRDHGPTDWESRAGQPPLLGVDDDVPEWVDRVRSLGNAVTPQIPELIGKAILEATHGTRNRSPDRGAAPAIG